MASERSPKVLEVMRLADVLWFVPRPARRPIADKLHGLGVRVHSELASLAVETPGPGQLANVTPQHVVALDPQKSLEFLKGAAAQTGSAHLANLAERVESASTPEELAAERARMQPLVTDSIQVVTDYLNRGDDLHDDAGGSGQVAGQ